MSLVADCFFLMKSENYDPFVVRWIWLKNIVKAQNLQIFLLSEMQKGERNHCLGQYFYFAP